MTPSPGWRHLFAGSSFAITIVAAVFAGVWADRKFDSDPWGVLLGALLGVAVATYNLIREFRDEPKS